MRAVQRSSLLPGHNADLNCSLYPTPAAPEPVLRIVSFLGVLAGTAFFTLRGEDPASAMAIVTTCAAVATGLASRWAPSPGWFGAWSQTVS